MSLPKVTIYGERCSGTSYLKELFDINFNVELTWQYGWKHFFGFNNLENSDDTLFIGIIRNLPDWVNSLYREKHHLPPHLTANEYTFLNDEFYSIDNNNEIIFDRNIETNKRYKNIFELRHVKNKFLVETMPTLVKNYVLITYDELLNDFNNCMNKIKKYLQVKSNIEFPLNVYYYKANKNVLFTKKQNEIPNDVIYSKANLFYEKILFLKE